MAKRRKKTVYIPMWECKLGVVNCPIEDVSIKSASCSMCPHNIAKIEEDKFEQWMNEHINKSIFFSKRGAEEYIDKVNKENKKGGALLNV